MGTLNVPGAKLYYEVSGQGPLLIMIPGAAGTGEVFRPLIASLAERYQVVVYHPAAFLAVSLTGLRIMIIDWILTPMMSGA